VLIFMLTVVAMIFRALGLANGELAMGLPDGSIRAVIALSLIVLFAILSIFLYQKISTGGPLVTIPAMSEADRSQFIRDRPNLRDIQVTATKDKTGYYDVSYRSGNPAADDFAKQLLVLLGTLMTAVTSFYLGAGTVSSAHNKASSDAEVTTTGPPDPKNFTPMSHSKSTDGAAIHLEITGTNLSAVKSVKISKDGAEPIVGTGLEKSAGKASCNLNVANAAAGAWDVEVDDGSSKPVKLTDKLTINA